MRLINVEQNTPEWMMARLGIPTASRFDSIMSPKMRKPSAGADKLMCQLLAERILGYPMNDPTSMFMDRGTELEPAAASAYELERDVDGVRVGLVLRDDGRCGCSPDRLIGDDGLLEIKCPSAPVHIMALLGKSGDEYVAQCQGQLWVTERRWVDLMFYNPEMPYAIVRIERDEEYIADLAECVEAFCDRLDATEADIRAMYAIRQPRMAEAAAAAAIDGMEPAASVDLFGGGK